MKIIERDDAIANEEAARKAYLLSLQGNKAFQKHYVKGIVMPLLKQLRDLKWIYEESKFVSATDGEISDIIRMNRNTYTALTVLLAPIMSEENKEKM